MIYQNRIIILGSYWSSLSPATAKVSASKSWSAFTWACCRPPPPCNKRAGSLTPCMSWPATTQQLLRTYYKRIYIYIYIFITKSKEAFPIKTFLIFIDRYIHYKIKCRSLIPILLMMMSLTLTYCILTDFKKERCSIILIVVICKGL